MTAWGAGSTRVRMVSQVDCYKKKCEDEKRALIPISVTYSQNSPFQNNTT